MVNENVHDKASYELSNTAEGPKQVEDKHPDPASAKKRQYDDIICYTVFVFFVLLLILVVMFRNCHGPLDFSLPINENTFSAFGNICGGFLGTAAALVGAILIVKTLEEQIEYNEKSQKTNDELLQATQESNSLYQKQQEQQDIQLFDSQFHSFFDLYKSAIDDYASRNGASSNGRDALNNIARKLLCFSPERDISYNQRLNVAVRYYERIYISYSDKMSTHFRMLYQLMRFISNADYIRESIRADYVNAVQDNLSESEMILLRYNCFCPFGEEMQQYVNEFDLLKHLPIMKLLEFKKWKDILRHQDYIYAVEILFTYLRNTITRQVTKTDNSDNNKQLKCGNNWKIVISYERAKNFLIVKIINSPNINEEKSAKTKIDGALARLGIKKLRICSVISSRSCS